MCISARQVDSHTHIYVTHTSSHPRHSHNSHSHWKTHFQEWRMCMLLTSTGFEAFDWRDLAKTLTHLPVLYKQHADGVLAAEVEYVNVVLNSHLREWLRPRRGERRTTGWETRSNSLVITFQVSFTILCVGLLNKRLTAFPDFLPKTLTVSIRLVFAKKFQLYTHTMLLYQK